LDSALQCGHLFTEAPAKKRSARSSAGARKSEGKSEAKAGAGAGAAAGKKQLDAVDEEEAGGEAVAVLHDM
jgi:hypothetical protein